MLTTRKSNIIKILNRVNDYITVDAIAAELNVSRRTIYNDLNELSRSADGFVIEKKQGVGVRIVWKEVGNFERELSHDSLRALGILKKLLFEEATVTVQELSEMFFVSPTSIMRDFIYIRRECLHDSTASLVSDAKGTRLEGSEEQLQKTFLAFNDLAQSMLAPDQFQLDDADYLVPYYGRALVQACLDLVKSLESYRLYSVAPHYERNVFNVLLVMSYRMTKGYHLAEQNNVFKVDEVMALKNYLIAKDLLEMLAEKVPFVYKETDIKGLSIYLQANRLEFKTASSYVYETQRKMVEAMIRRMSECINVDLMSDETLYQNLMVHCYHMIYRGRHGIIIRNPLLEDIKVEFRLMFDLVSLVVEELQEEMQIKLTEDEIAFLMLHFQHAVDKKQKSRKILVVCPNGVVTSNFILGRIRSILSPLDIIESVSSGNVEKFSLDHIDMIISTVPLLSVRKTVVVVSPLITQKDLDAISKAYHDYVSWQEDNSEIEIRNLSPFIKKEYLFCSQRAQSMHEIIHIVSETLLSDGYVQEGYEESLFERELNGGTELATGAAVPHGSMDLVRKTIVPIWINQFPVKWGKYQVKVVIFFVLAKKDLTKAKPILEDIFKIIKSKCFIENTLICFTQKELYAFLNGGLRFDSERISTVRPENGKSRGCSSDDCK